jgi:hypothetical protein
MRSYSEPNNPWKRACISLPADVCRNLQALPACNRLFCQIPPVDAFNTVCIQTTISSRCYPHMQAHFTWLAVIAASSCSATLRPPRFVRLPSKCPAASQHGAHCPVVAACA